MSPAPVPYNEGRSALASHFEVAPCLDDVLSVCSIEAAASGETVLENAIRARLVPLAQLNALADATPASTQGHSPRKAARIGAPVGVLVNKPIGSVNQDLFHA